MKNVANWQGVRISIWSCCPIMYSIQKVHSDVKLVNNYDEDD